MRAIYIRTLCIAIIMIFALFYSYAGAATSADILQQRNAIVSISVIDKNDNMIASGSGFVVDQSGVIVTNCSLIAKWYQKMQNMLVIRTEGGVNLTLDSLLSSRCENNLAVLKVKGTGIPAVRLDAGYKLRQGESVFITENTSGSEATVSRGVVKGFPGKKLIQVSFPVTREKSGTPVFNTNAEVVGALIYIPAKKQPHNFAAPLPDIMKQLSKYATPKKTTWSSASQPKPVIKEDLKDKDAATQYFLLGVNYEKTNMLKEAIRSFEQSLSINPGYFDAYVNLGITSFRMGRYTDAVQAYKEALKIKPDSASTYNKLGTTYITQGDYSNACGAFRKVLEIEPKNTFAHFNLGIAYYLAGNKSEAYKEYVILKDLDKKYAEKLSDLIF